MKNRFTKRIAGVTVCGGLLLCCATAAAHPFHISSAEMEWNAETLRFEVSLKVHASDLERAAGRLVGRKINIEREPSAKELLTDYLKKHFYLAHKQSVAAEPVDDPPGDSRSAQGVDESIQSNQEVDSSREVDSSDDARSRLHFVGSELETSWLWLYFELEPPPVGSELVLVNSVLVDLIEGQINTVTLRSLGKKQTLTTTAKKPIAESAYFVPAKNLDLEASGSRQDFR